MITIIYKNDMHNILDVIKINVLRSYKNILFEVAFYEISTRNMISTDLDFCP